MRVLNEKDSQLRNMVSQFGDDFFMYGQYNLETTESVIEFMNGMMKQQSSLQCIKKGLDINWLSHCLDQASGPVLNGFQLQLYIQVLSERNTNMHEYFRTSLRTVMTTLAKLSEGYLPIEILLYQSLR